MARVVARAREAAGRVEMAAQGARVAKEATREAMVAEAMVAMVEGSCNSKTSPWNRLRARGRRPNSPSCNRIQRKRHARAAETALAGLGTAEAGSAVGVWVGAAMAVEAAVAHSVTVAVAVAISETVRMWWSA